MINGKSGMVEHIYHISTWEVEAGGSGVESQPQLYSKFKARIRNLQEFLPQIELSNGHYDIH